MDDYDMRPPSIFYGDKEAQQTWVDIVANVLSILGLVPMGKSTTIAFYILRCFIVFVFTLVTHLIYRWLWVWLAFVCTFTILYAGSPILNSFRLFNGDNHIGRKIV